MAKTPKTIVVPPLSDAMYARGSKTSEESPYDVVRARFDKKSDCLHLVLRKGVKISFPRSEIREIAKMKPEALGSVEVQPGGDGISFRTVDVDISVPGLLADELGTLFAKALGARTRGKTSRQKALASRKNGRKGGRPRKNTAA